MAAAARVAMAAFEVSFICPSHSLSNPVFCHRQLFLLSRLFLSSRFRRGACPALLKSHSTGRREHSPIHKHRRAGNKRRPIAGNNRNRVRNLFRPPPPPHHTHPIPRFHHSFPIPLHPPS